MGFATVEFQSSSSKVTTNFYPGGNETDYFGHFQPWLLLLLQGDTAQQQRIHEKNGTWSCLVASECSDGLILPAWEPRIEQGDVLTTTFRAFVYLIALAYMLFGINVITERMLAAIEVIVSQKRAVVVTAKSGETHTVHVPRWHHVVATLTVYVIGTSTPEIFLPIAEVFKRRFEADDLGPAVVVGSGAYHLFLVTGVCLASCRSPRAKQIRDLNVFFVTAAYAIFAYLWIWAVVAVSSPGIIELWEALATLAMFPAIVVTTWAIERRFIWRMWLRAIITWRHLQGGTSSRHETVIPDDIEHEDEGVMLDTVYERRRRLKRILHELRSQYPEKTRAELEELAEIRLIEEMPKDAVFYRLQAGKAFSGGGNIISKERIKKRMREQRKQRKMSVVEMATDPNAQLVTFEHRRVTCMENCGELVLQVLRSGAGIDDTLLIVGYQTLEGTAKFGQDMEPSHGQLVFEPGKKVSEIRIRIVDDDEFEEDKEFAVCLLNPILKLHSSRMAVETLVRNQGPSSPGWLRVPSVKRGRLSMQPSATPSQASTISVGVRSHSTPSSPVPAVVLGISSVSVRILDDDHCGVFSFEVPEMPIADNIGTAKIKVVRSTGARGRVAVPYRISAGTAKPNDDYLLPFSIGRHLLPPVVVFENDQFEAFIGIDIIDKNRVGEVATFYIELLEPELQTAPPKNPLGKPLLGSPKIVKLGICEDDELKDALDRLLNMADLSTLVGSTSWRDQFLEAIRMPAIFSEEERLDQMEVIDNSTHPPATRRRASSAANIWQRSSTMAIYCLSLPWRLLAASLPPTALLQGWLAFVSILCLLALIAALTGDLASAFGCTVGIKDSVTAVTLIAFGMGLPDTFASRHAAMNERTADAAIGHITGSNAVSVFLGIGISWTIASAYHSLNDGQFVVPPGSLGLSVTIYCLFATAGIVALLLRRLPPIHGELGGPTTLRIASASFFFALWIAFVGLNVLENYCIIAGF